MQIVSTQYNVCEGVPVSKPGFMRVVCDCVEEQGRACDYIDESVYVCAGVCTYLVGPRANFDLMNLNMCSSDLS